MIWLFMSDPENPPKNICALFGDYHYLLQLYTYVYTFCYGFRTLDAWFLIELIILENFCYGMTMVSSFVVSKVINVHHKARSF